MESRASNILIVATTASMIEQFNLHNIQILMKLGAVVHVATNFSNPGTITKENSEKLIKYLEEKGVYCHQVNFHRGIGTHSANKEALNQLCKIIKKYNINGIHAHSPLGGIIARRVAHKMKVKIIYTAHGFQFFKGGPLKDWIIFFPIEWFYAHWTDALITINTDDFSISKFLPVKRKYYIPGVGTNVASIINFDSNSKRILRERTRKRLSVNKNDYLIISVGELSKRKNHATVLKAIKKLNNPSIKYVIAGIGPEKSNLLRLINQLKLTRQVQLLGYINNLDGLYFAADLNVFISTREGLGLGGLDGVAHGLYIIGNNRTGMKDYIINNRIGLLVNNPMNINEVAQKIKMAMNNFRNVNDKTSILKFDHRNVDQIMTNIYKKEFNLE